MKWMEKKASKGYTSAIGCVWKAKQFKLSLKWQDELQIGSKRRTESKNMSKEWNQVCVSVQGQSLIKDRSQDILKLQQQ